MSKTFADMIAPLALKGLKPGQIASLLGVKVDTVRGTMSRLRRAGVQIDRHTAFDTPYVPPRTRKEPKACTTPASSSLPSLSVSPKPDGAKAETLPTLPKASSGAASTYRNRPSQIRSPAFATVECASAPPMPPEMERRIEKLKEKAAGDEAAKTRLACGLHHLDLIRAGFSYGHGELVIPNEERGRPMMTSVGVPRSYCGSPAGMCVG